MLFDSSLRREVARGFGGTLIVILTIVLTMMLIRTLGQAAGGSVSPQDVVLLMGYTALGQLPTMLSLSLFIAVISALTRMYRDSEMVIWLSSGVSLLRVVPVLVRTALPVLVAIGVLALLVWPWANQQGVELRGRYEQRSDLSRVAPGQFQSSADGQRVFFIDKDSQEGVVGRNVFVLARQQARESITTAQSGRIVTGPGGEQLLLLDRGSRTDIDTASNEKTLAQFEQYQVVVGEKALRGLDDLPPKARSSLELVNTPNNRNQAELTWRLGLLLIGVNLLLLAIGLSAGNPRRGGSWNLLLALLVFVVYFNLLNLSQAWVAVGRMGLGEALLAVHGSVFAAALLLLWWRDRGAAAFGPRLAWRAGTAR